MKYQGEYPQPLSRSQVINVPVVPGSCTARLEAYAIPANAEDKVTVAIVENVGLTQLDVQLREVDNWASGARTNVSSALSIVPGGRQTVTINPAKRYMEIWGTTAADHVNAQVRLQLESKIRWNVLGFGKDDASYAKLLWQPQGL